MVFQLNKNIFSIAQSETTLKGPHNLINTMSAVSAVFFAGAEVGSIKSGLKTFINAPHRLEAKDQRPKTKDEISNWQSAIGNI